MQIGESIGTAIFLMIVVFLGLLGLFLCIKFFSFIVRRIEKDVVKVEKGKPKYKSE